MSQEELGHTIWMFFPEAIPALIVALCAPFWVIKMFGNGDLLPAICLIMGEVACGYGFVHGWRFSGKWIAYGSMLAFLVLSCIVESMTK